MAKVQSEEEFCRYVFEQYFVERRYEILGDLITEQISVIGTGSHEISRNAEEFALAMDKESKEWEGCFIIKDQWYQTTKLADTHSLVMGEIEVREDTRDAILYNIRFRFSVVLAKTGDSWRILHIHQSVPDANQSSDEFFPHHIVEKDYQQIIYNLKHDTMTGLLNRLYLKETADRFIADMRAGMLLMMDIDKFKQMNDQFGHPFGDKVLIALSQSLKTVFSKYLTGRVGGDEFVVYIPGIQTMSELEPLLSVFKNDWKEQQRSLKLPYEVTISMGISSCPAHGTAYDELWKRADEALYKAKAEGFGKVSCYTSL